MHKLAVALLVLVGCASDADPLAVAEVGVDPAPAPERSAPAAAVRDEAPASKLDGYQLPGSTDPLGKACERAKPADGQAAGQPQVDRCGTKGRVAMEVRTTALVRERPPCEWVSLEKDNVHLIGAHSRYGCIDGDHLVVTSHCIVCRSMDAGSAFHVRLGELDAAQLAYLRDALGYQKENIDTPEKWRSLVASGKSVEKPDVQ